MATEDLQSKSLEQLLRTLSEETTTLVRQELKLARAEMLEKGKQAGVSAAFFSSSAVLGIGAFGALTFCFITALGLILPLWAASLITAVVYGIGAFIAVQRGKTLLAAATPLTPELTTRSLKEDMTWTKIRAESGRK